MRYWLTTKQTGSGYRFANGPLFLKTYLSVDCNMSPGEARLDGLQPSLKNVRQKILPNGQTRLSLDFVTKFHNTIISGTSDTILAQRFLMLQPLWWCCVDCVIHHERHVREEQKYMYVARTSNNRVISSGDLYCCLLPRCEVLRTCRSGFPIATLRIQQNQCFALFQRRRLCDDVFSTLADEFGNFGAVFDTAIKESNQTIGYKKHDGISNYRKAFLIF